MAEESKKGRYEAKLYQKLSRPEDKKQVAIKEISRVLNDIEESNKTRKIIYFSNICKKNIFDSLGKKVGRLNDLAISGGERFPEVSHIQLEKDKTLIKWQEVKEFEHVIRLEKPYEKTEKRATSTEDILLNEHILDKQVVDVNGLKVIRVNDLALTYIKQKLAVVSIDIGTRSIFRRLGFERLGEMLHATDHPIPWDTIEPLTSSLEKVHLKIPCPRVADLHPADVAELFDELSHRERRTLLRSMKSETAARVLLECEPGVQQSILKGLTSRRIASIAEKMPANDAANLLSEHDRLNRILRAMNKALAIELQKALSYKPGTAARYMDHCISVRQDTTIRNTIEEIRQKQEHPDNFYYVYVTDEEGALTGVISLKHLILADPEAKAEDIMVIKPYSVELSEPLELATELLTKYDLMAIPVVDISGRLQGMINIEAVLDVAIERTKAKEPFELTEEQKIQYNKRFKNYYLALVRDVGQFLRDLEPLKLRRKNGENRQDPDHANSEHNRAWNNNSKR
ncbi:MAG: CBS domain-containing protein [Candidatus Woesearchaeota archaeon]